MNVFSIMLHAEMRWEDGKMKKVLFKIIEDITNICRYIKTHKKISLSMENLLRSEGDWINWDKILRCTKLKEHVIISFLFWRVIRLFFFFSIVDPQEHFECVTASINIWLRIQEASCLIDFLFSLSRFRNFILYSIHPLLLSIWFTHLTKKSFYVLD